MTDQARQPDDSTTDAAEALSNRLTSEVLLPMKSVFVGKDEIIDLFGVCLVAGENLFLLGPPGTAKSALVSELGKRIEGRTFEYLLTRFTEPNEIFGPFDIRKLREGDLVTNTQGMLPEASLVFLDELLNANSAILNSLLMVLNERVFRRGRETRTVPLLMAVGASNDLPQDEALQALFDRFLMRVRCENVEEDRLAEVLQAGWKLATAGQSAPPLMSIDDIRKLNSSLATVDLTPVRTPMVELTHRLREAGIAISDRRAVKLQRLVAASALLCNRNTAMLSDLWVFRYIWDKLEQQEVLAAIVQEAIESNADNAHAHPRAMGVDRPDPEILAREIAAIERELDETTGESAAGDLNRMRDRLGLLAGRCEWVETSAQRDFLKQQIDSLWSRLEPQNAKSPA